MEATVTTAAAPGNAFPWLQRVFFGEAPAARLAAFRVLVCFTALYDLWLYAPVVLRDAALVDAGGPLRPWNPLVFVQVLGITPIGSDLANVVLIAGTVALVAGMLGLASRTSCALGAIAFFWTTGLAYSFGKPHHDKVALAFALAALPFAPIGAAGSLDAWWRRWRGAGARAASGSALPIAITQFTLLVGYGGAGLGKLLLGGLDWFNGYTLQGIMLGHDGPWSRTFASSVLLCQAQSIGVVLTQAAFPLVIVWPRTRWFFLPAATAFHLMTWQTMDTGPYMRVWLLLWAFVPIEQVPATLQRWWSERPFAAALASVALFAYGALVVDVAAEVLPRPALLAGVVIVVAVGGSARRRIAGLHR